MYTYKTICRYCIYIYIDIYICECLHIHWDIEICIYDMTNFVGYLIIREKCASLMPRKVVRYTMFYEKYMAKYF